jgi:hypothetical protein
MRVPHLTDDLESQFRATGQAILTIGPVIFRIGRLTVGYEAEGLVPGAGAIVVRARTLEGLRLVLERIGRGSEADGPPDAPGGEG